MTNAHVVRGSTSVEVRIEGRGSPLYGEPIYYNADEDISVLRIPGARRAPPLQIHPRPTVGSSVAVLGPSAGATKPGPRG